LHFSDVSLLLSDPTLSTRAPRLANRVLRGHPAAASLLRWDRPMALNAATLTQGARALHLGAGECQAMRAAPCGCTKEHLDSAVTAGSIAEVRIFAA